MVYVVKPYARWEPPTVAPTEREPEPEPVLQRESKAQPKWNAPTIRGGGYKEVKMSKEDRMKESNMSVNKSIPIPSTADKETRMKLQRFINYKFPS